MSDRKSVPPLVPPGDIRQRFGTVLPAEDAAALELLFVLRETAHQVDLALSGWLGQDALSPGRWQVLMVLWAQSQPVPQRVIVQALKVSRANVSELVDTLQAEGQVTCAADPTDRRQMLVSLTPAGRALTSRLIQQNAARLRTRFANLDHAGLLALTRSLNQLIDKPA